jgi:tRNA A37 threonylcarbamoyladenosine synthetase subunit TsaC/SUA5/YrdC
MSYAFKTNSLYEMDIEDGDLLPVIAKILKRENPVFMLEMPTVYALVAPSTIAGVRAMNNAKRRLPGKVYGSVIGSFSNFLKLATFKQVNSIFNGDLSFFSCLEGSFIRIPVASKNIDTPSINRGTHQGLLLSQGPLRTLFENIEKLSHRQDTSAIFPMANYHAPLCTSANISGDPRGSITDIKQARIFADYANIDLIVRTNHEEQEKGSYPILSFEGNKISVERQGPGLQRILSGLPSLFEIIHA